MTHTKTTILYQRGDYFVTAASFGNSVGYTVFRNGVTAAERVAAIGYPGNDGLRRAIAECDRREALRLTQTTKENR